MNPLSPGQVYSLLETSFVESTLYPVLFVLAVLIIPLAFVGIGRWITLPERMAARLACIFGYIGVVGFVVTAVRGLDVINHERRAGAISEFLGSGRPIEVRLIDEGVVELSLPREVTVFGQAQQLEPRRVRMSLAEAASVYDEAVKLGYGKTVEGLAFGRSIVAHGSPSS